MVVPLPKGACDDDDDVDAVVCRSTCRMWPESDTDVIKRNQCPCRKCLGNLQSFVSLHKASAGSPAMDVACSDTLLQSKRFRITSSNRDNAAEVASAAIPAPPPARAEAEATTAH